MTSRGFRDIIFHSVVVFDFGENWSMASYPNKNSECGIHRHRGEIKLLRKRPWCDDQRHGGACVFTVKTQSSPYINRFLQPDTIIPDLSNPQGWNRYSYVNNRPVIFNDPTGHCPTCGAGTMTLAGFGVLGIGAIGAALLAPDVLAIAAGVAVVAIVAITVLTVVEMAKSGSPATKYRKDEQNISTSDKTVDDPGGGGPWQIDCKGAIATILCGTAILRIAKYSYDAVNCMIDEKSCNYAPIKEKIIVDPKSTQTSTPTSTATSTPGCPPYAQCPTHTATASMTPSASNTPTPTSTATSTPTLPPSPTYVPLTPRRRGGQLFMD